MKKFGAVLVLLALIAGWSLLGRAEADPVPATDTDINLLKRAFSATTAEPGCAEINGWAVLAQDYYSPREAEAIVQGMADVFELNRNEYEIVLRSTGHYGYAIMEFDLSESFWLRLQVQSLDDETIASVEIRQTNHRGLDIAYDQVKRALLAAGAPEQDVKITSCLEGYIDARLRDSEKLNTAYAAFNAVDAVFQEGMDEGGVAVWSGWSPSFIQTVNTGFKDVNFGIALRSKSGSRKTIVLVATPVLPGSY